MTTMIEQVARALCEAGYDIDPFMFHYQYETRRASYDALARAAIEAMREPTDAMVSAMIWQVNDWQNEKGTDQDVWYAPITAALEETQ